jgi:hypothetical protein
VLRELERKLSVLILVYTILVVVSAISLYLLGERRVDVYVSLNILSYYVSYAIMRPSYTSRSIRLLNIVLFAVFTVIVSFRVYEVLTS